MKSKFITILAFAAVTLFSTKDVSALQACIIDEFGELFSITVEAYNSPGNIKTVTGTADFSLYGAGIWTVDGTVTKSTKTLYLHCVNPGTGGCIDFADYADIAFSYTGSFYNMSGSFTNNCGVSGSISATGSVKGLCSSPQKPIFSEGVHSGVGASQHPLTVSHVSNLATFGSPDFAATFFGVRTIAAQPNPARDFTAISFTLENDGLVSVAVYNQLCQLVKQLSNSNQKAGSYQVIWDVTDLSGNRVESGIYILRLQTQSEAQTTPIIVE